MIRTIVKLSRSLLGSFGSVTRYGVVGAVSNVTLYALYLGMTFFGIQPLIAATILYVIGLSVTYVVNRSWSFKSSRSHASALPWYIAVYVAGYFVYIGILWALHYGLELPHQIAVLCGGVVVFMMSASLLKRRVFSQPGPQPEAGSTLEGSMPK